jgi:hypothetical protein
MCFGGKNQPEKIEAFETPCPAGNRSEAELGAANRCVSSRYALLILISLRGIFAPIPRREINTNRTREHFYKTPPRRVIENSPLLPNSPRGFSCFTPDKIQEGSLSN